MAFRGRGSSPGRRSSGGGFGGNGASNRGVNGHRVRSFGLNSWLGHHHARPIYVTYNFGAVLVMEVLLILVGIFAYLYSYESVYIIDPIEKAKMSFLDIQFGGTLLYVFLLLVANYFKDVPKKALKCFVGLFVLAVVFCVSIGFAKLSMDKKYTAESFDGMYSNVYFKDNAAVSGGYKVSTSDSNSKDLFNRECVRLYDSFTFKVLIGFVVQIFIMLLNLYLIVSVAKSKERFEKAQKENDVLFDEEQNVKY